MFWLDAQLLLQAQIFERQAHGVERDEIGTSCPYACWQSPGSTIPTIGAELAARWLRPARAVVAACPVASAVAVVVAKASA